MQLGHFVTYHIIQREKQRNGLWGGQNHEWDPQMPIFNDGNYLFKSKLFGLNHCPLKFFGFARSKIHENPPYGETIRLFE